MVFCEVRPPVALFTPVITQSVPIFGMPFQHDVAVEGPQTFTAPVFARKQNIVK